MSVVRYDLSDDESASLASELLRFQAEALPRTPLTCVRIAGTSRFANLARRVEASVFSAEFGDSIEDIAEDHRPYEERSYFFLAMDIPARTAIGALRVIEHGPSGLPTLHVVKDPPYGVATEAFYEAYAAVPERTWDVGTIAVDPQYRAEATSSVATGLLYRSLYAGAIANGIDHFVSLISLLTLSKLRSLGIPFDDLMGLPPKTYGDGTEYQPAVARLDEFDGRMRDHAQNLVDAATDDQRRARAEFKRSLIDALLTGTGFDELIAFNHADIRTHSI